MNLTEKILVVCDTAISYNLCPGGKGGFGFINDSFLNIDLKHQRWKKGYNTKIKNDPDCHKKYWKLGVKVTRILYGEDFFIKNGKRHAKFLKENNMGIFDPLYKYSSQTKESKEKRKQSFQNNKHQQGDKNSQFGTCWITNGQENKKINKKSLDEWTKLGYYKGRLYK